MQEMRYSFRYGAGHITVDADALASVHEVVPRSAAGQSDVWGAVLSALEHPVGADSPASSISDSSTVTVVIDRPSETFPAREVLAPVLSSLQAKALNPKDITILVTHQHDWACTEDDVNRLLDDPVSRGYRLLLHDPTDGSRLRRVGETPTSRTPLEVNKSFLEADYKIALSSIRPDPFAGATGGGMSILPGLCGQEGIVRHMRVRATTKNAPLAVDSPAGVDMSEAALLAGLDFIVNTVPDWRGSLADIVSGNPTEAWSRGVESSMALSSVPIPGRSDLVVVSAGGFPFDRTLYDAIDSLYAAQLGSRRDGVILLIAECAQGLGPKGFAYGVTGTKSEKEVTSMIESKFELGMEKARLFWSVNESRNLILWSELPRSVVTKKLHCSSVHEPQEAMEVARSYLESGSKATFMPNGRATVLPSA